MRSIRLTLLLIVGVFPWPAAADVVYQYTGLPFTSFFSSPAGAPNPYTTADSVSITLSFSSLLPGNLSDANIQPLVSTYTFTDGFQTITPANATTDLLPVFWFLGLRTRRALASTRTKSYRRL